MAVNPGRHGTGRGRRLILIASHTDRRDRDGHWTCSRITAHQTHHPFHRSVRAPWSSSIDHRLSLNEVGISRVGND